MILLQCCYSYEWSEEEIDLLYTIQNRILVSIGQAHIIQIEKEKEIAQQSNIAKSQFLAVMSHELR